jgi:lincosamide nucleotidyltransferase A/C/D/E
MSKHLFGPEGQSNFERAEAPERKMPADHVIEVHELLTSHEIDIWIDGGWGVDALLGEQTREHGDLDVAIQARDLPKMRALLEERGYNDKGEEHARPWNFILKDQTGHEIDVHAIDLDSAGNGIYGPPENGEMYPASSLRGMGVIAGRRVQCISAEDMVKFHSGYELDQNDFHDVLALCKKFGIEIPEEYRQPPTGAGQARANAIRPLP